MRALKLAVAVMGVLIVAGVAVLAVAIFRVVLPPPAAAVSAVLNEPPGTRIAGTSALPDRLILQLSGGGPDRVVIVDLRSGRLLGRAALAN